jgi:hypothetical protein
VQGKEIHSSLVVTNEIHNITHHNRDLYSKINSNNKSRVFVGKEKDTCCVFLHLFPNEQHLFFLEKKELIKLLKG